MMVDRAADYSILGDDMLDTNDYDFDAPPTAVTEHGALLEYLSEDMQDDETIVSAVVREDPTSLVYTSKRLRDKESIVALTAVDQRDSGSYKPVSRFNESWDSPEGQEYWKSIRDDKSAVMFYISDRGCLLEHVSDRLKNDPDIVMAAVENNPMSLRFASDAMRNNLEIAKMAVSEPFHDIIRDDGVWKIDGRYPIEFVPETFRDDREFMRTAISVYGDNFKFASERLKDDFSFVIFAVEKDDDLLEHASKRICDMAGSLPADDFKSNYDKLLSLRKFSRCKACRK